MDAAIIFPHQLFLNHPVLKKHRIVYLVEEPLFFKQYAFHKQKLVLHMASMKSYESWLKSAQFEVIYVDSNSPQSNSAVLIADLHSKGVEHVHVVDPEDDWLKKRLNKAIQNTEMSIHFYDSPQFINTQKDLSDYFKADSKYFQTSFYTHFRKKHRILVDDTFKPIGGKWSFDAENRERVPKGFPIPKMPDVATSLFLKEAVDYVEKHFAENPGMSAPFIYPIQHKAAEEWLDDFFKQRFVHFGRFEDAIVHKESFLFHSVITPMLNIGLLQPKQIVDKSIAYAEKNNIPFNALEGFIRQILGWREFMRAVYLREGVKQRNSNFWQFKNKIPKSFWEGNTGIPPIDITIEKIKQTGYCHHIERLMVLGNFMLLCEFDPNEVYEWFMVFFIDAYDWVMVPNIYGMSQFADGGLTTTKPYISGSNYIMKMGDYPKGEWQKIWDALFWRFMHVHRDFFLQNPRLGMLIRTFDKMDPEKQKQHLETAENWLKKWK
jgi:deoxyribodipyrimidine photolyase-related protein